MIHHLYRVTSLCGVTEEFARTAEDAAIQHTRAFAPITRLTATATCGGITLAFHVKPTVSYRAFPVPLPGCFEARQ